MTYLGKVVFGEVEESEPGVGGMVAFSPPVLLDPQKLPTVASSLIKC